MRIKTVASVIFNLALAAQLMACASAAKSSHTPLTKEERMGDIYLTAGTEKLIDGNYTEALRNLLLATKYTPKSTDAWNNLGIAYYEKQQIEKAKDCWEKALSINSDFSDAHNNLGTMYLNQNKLKKAEEEFKIVLKDLVYNKVHQTHYNLSVLYSRQGKNILAEQHLRLAVKENDTYCPAWEKLAKMEEQRGDLLQALQSLKGATSGVCYANPEAHFEIASLYLQAQDAASAKIKLLEIVEHFPSSPWARKAEARLQTISEVGRQ